MLTSSTKLILAILVGAPGAVLLGMNSIGAPDELGDPGNILIRYGAPALVVILALLYVRSCREMSPEPSLGTRYNEVVMVVGAVAFVIGILVWGLFYIMLVLFHPTPAL